MRASALDHESVANAFQSTDTGFESWSQGLEHCAHLDSVIHLGKFSESLARE